MTNLRLPYSVSVVNSDALVVSVVNSDVLTVTVINSHTLRLSIYNPKVDDTLYAEGGKMATIIAYQDDVGYDLQFTVKDVDGNPFNLTGATVYFRACFPCSNSLKINGVCTLDVDPTTGQCTYTTVSGDFDTPGAMNAELYISVGGKEIRIQGMVIDVIKRLPTT